MNLPIPFRLSKLDEPVPYSVIDEFGDLQAQCDDITRRLDANQRALDEIERMIQAF